MGRRRPLLVQLVASLFTSTGARTPALPEMCLSTYRDNQKTSLFRREPYEEGCLDESTELIPLGYQ